MKHRPGIETLIHLHDGDAADLVSGEDRALTQPAFGASRIGFGRIKP
jgi:hypothetical protein